MCSVIIHKSYLIHFIKNVILQHLEVYFKLSKTTEFLIY